MILDKEATVICISFMRTPENNNLQKFLDIFVHPIKERSYTDMSQLNEHLYSRGRIEDWIKEGKTIYVTDEILKQLEKIGNIMDEQKAAYFRLIKH